MWKGAFPETSNPLNYAKMKNVLKEMQLHIKNYALFLARSVSTKGHFQ